MSSKRNRLAALWATLLIWLAHAQSANGEIHLDKLTDCDDVAKLEKFITEEPDGICRKPSDPLENALIARSGIPVSKICFLRKAPAAMLEGFSCMLPQLSEPARDLTCFRPADAIDVREYKEQYKQRFAAVSKKYLADASKCSASNGDTSEMGKFSVSVLVHIARVEFGFIAGLGNTPPPNKMVALHGFATTDPSISNNIPNAIEFVQVYIGDSSTGSKEELKVVGDWEIGIEDQEEFDDLVNGELRKRQQQLRVDGISYAFRRRTTKALAEEEKLALTDRLHADIVGTLVEEGFDEMTDAALRKTGMSKEEMIEKVNESMPFGSRRVSPLKLAPFVSILINESRPTCASEGQGAMAAMLMGFRPIAEVVTDYGGLQLAILGLGACARGGQHSATTKYMRGLIEEATESVVSNLK